MAAGRRIGITGSAGFLGSHLVDSLLDAGHRVTGIDNLEYGRRENFAHHLDNPDFTFLELDVVDAERTVAALLGCDVIVHLAAHKIPRYGNAVRMLQINGEGAHNVLEAARRRQERGEPVHVVMASTSDVYGKNPKLPFAETDDLVLGPSHIARWAYGVSKLYEEHLGFAYNDECGFPVSLLRFFGSYGPRHHLSWWGGPQSVFMTAVMEGQEISIHGDGKQTRTFTFVEDTVRGIRAAMDREGGGCEVFNIGAAEGEITIHELAALIHRLVREECPDLEIPVEPRLALTPYESFSSKPYEDVRRRVPDPAKAERMLGFRARVPLEEGLRRTIRWHRDAIGRATRV